MQTQSSRSAPAMVRYAGRPRKHARDILISVLHLVVPIMLLIGLTYLFGPLTPAGGTGTALNSAPATVRPA